MHAVAQAWARYQEYVDLVRSAIENARFKVDPGMVETVNELLHIVYEGGRYTTELARELQIRQNELYQREPPKRKELDIYDLVRRAYQESVAESQSREQTYELIAEDRGVKVFGVENELKRPFIQIIENAIKYTPVGGKVTVRLEYEPSHILFSVQDTGIGIPPGEEEQVFGLCERCSNAKDFNKAGTGTGLFNDRKIILHHNGQIWVKSAGLNQGSTFFIRIPIQHHPKTA
jgi:signal transduction histidine kinase